MANTVQLQGNKRDEDLEIVTELSAVLEGSQNEARIKARDIAELLKLKLAFLSGGKDTNGCLAVTIPYHAHFNQTSEADLEKVFKYLLSLPSQELHSKGFILILDKRKDKWSGVKLALTRIQSCFPATVNSVFVLKPQGFFQKYTQHGFTTAGLNPTFNIKIETLSSVHELLNYIAGNQLTPDVGGSLNYQHAEWIEHRTAIEGFGGKLSSIKDRLRNLQRSCIKAQTSPNIQEMQQSLELQEKLWNEAKEDCASTLTVGEALLKCIRSSDDEESENSKISITPDAEANACELEKCIRQLEDLSTIFTRFWKSHQLKMHQGLQLCRFEQEVNLVTGTILAVIGNLTAMTDVGDSKSEAESLVSELTEFSESSQNSLEKGKILAEKGEKMIADGHYSRESVALRCKELQAMREEFDNKVRRREDALKKAMDIHDCLEQVGKWCNSGVDLLASQPVDRFQSSEGAEKALKEIDNFLKTPQGINLRKLNKMEQMAKDCENKYLMYKVKNCLKRIGEVNDMMAKRESSLNKMVVKRPVQPVTPISPVIADKKRKVSTDEKNGPKPKSPASNPKGAVSIVITRDNSPPSPILGKKMASIEDLYMYEGLDQVDSEEIGLLKKRLHVMLELIETEKDYVADLECIIKGYLKEFENTRNNIPTQLKGKKNIVFGNIEQIYDFHKNVFLGQLQSYSCQPLLVGEGFIDNKEQFEMYAAYCRNKPDSEALRKEFVDLPFFKDCQVRLKHKLPLSAFLLKPVQRISKYQLLLREMMRYATTDKTAYAELQEAWETMQAVLRHVNDVMHSTGLRGFHGNLAEQGKLLLQGSFVTWHSNKRGLPPLKGRQRQVFLYQKLVVFSKKDEECNKDSVLYHYKNSIKMCDVGLTETVKGDPTKFELWLQRRSEVYVFQASSVEVKERWVKAIRNALMMQFDEVKETVKEQTKGGKSLRDSYKWKSTSALTEPLDSTSDNSVMHRTRSHSSLGGARYQPLSPGDHRRHSCIVERLSAENSFDDIEEDFDDYDSEEWSDGSGGETGGDTASQDSQSASVTPSTLYTALATYHPLEENEMSFQEGDQIEILRLGKDGWWYGRHLGTLQEGWIPASYLELKNH